MSRRVRHERPGATVAAKLSVSLANFRDFPNQLHKHLHVQAAEEEAGIRSEIKHDLELRRYALRKFFEADVADVESGQQNCDVTNSNEINTFLERIVAAIALESNTL